MSYNTTKCPVCETGDLSTARTSLEIMHHGQHLNVDGIDHSVCDSCGAEPILPEQIRKNDLRIADAKRATDGLLCSDEIRNLRHYLGLSQLEAAQIFGGGTNAFSKYERGDVIQSLPMDRLMRVTLAFPWLVELLRAQAGLATAYESFGNVEFEYRGEVTIRVNASDYPGSTLPGRTDVTPINDDDYGDWKNAA